MEEANQAAFKALPGEELTWQAQGKSLSKEYAAQLEANCAAPRLLRLKVGAQVMLLKNLVRRPLACTALPPPSRPVPARTCPTSCSTGRGAW